MTDTFTSTQLINSAMLRGLCSKLHAERWVNDHPQKVYIEFDLQRMYYDVTHERVRTESVKELPYDEENRFFDYIPR